MPKSRKTKAKYQDFQKVKLKAGRKLPKGLNETSTAFKSRSIQIRDQHKPDNSEPTTHKKLNINDLLSHLQHYNTSVRLDALSGLRELFASTPNIIHKYLPQLLSRLSSLCLDKDGVVRDANCRLFRLMLSQITTSQLAPFFQILSAHLCCAMTHIDDDIQVDSLSLLDLFLERYPTLVTSSQCNLLSNFIAQLSRQRQTGKSNALKRSLLINPSSKLSSHKWRLNVIKRLYCFLEAVVDHRSTSKNVNNVTIITDTVSWSAENAATGHLIIKNKSDALGNGFLLRTQLVDKDETADALSDESKLRSTVETLLPLLLQSWVEVGPAQLTTNRSGNVMSSDALLFLENILGIIRLLLCCVKQQDEEEANVTLDWMRKQYMKEFTQYFLPYFPFAMTDQIQSKRSRKNKVKPAEVKVSVLSLNLAVCHMMTYFLDKNSNLSEVTWFMPLKSFVIQTLNNFHGTRKDLQIAIQILLNLADLRLEQNELEELLTPTYVLYAGRNATSSAKLMLFRFFSNLVLVQHSISPSLVAVKRWMQHLPTHLSMLKSTSNDTSLALLGTMRQLAAQGHQELLTVIQEHGISLIELLNSLDTSAQKAVFDLLFWLPFWERQHLICLSKIIQMGSINAASLTYILQILNYRYQTNRGLTAADFTSFLFSSIVNTTQEILEKLQEKHEHVQSPFTHQVHMSGDDLANWMKHDDIAKVICNCVVHLGNDEQLWDIWLKFLSKIMRNKVLPLSSVKGLLLLISQVYRPQHNLPTDSLLYIDNLIGSLLITLETAADNEDNENLISGLKGSIIGCCTSLLLKVKDAWTNYIKILLSFKGISVELLRVIVKNVTSFLHQTKFPALVGKDITLLNQWLKQIEDEHTDIDKHQWWTDFKYHLSTVR